MYTMQPRLRGWGRQSKTKELDIAFVVTMPVQMVASGLMELGHSL